MGKLIDWNHVFLLGWRDSKGVMHTTRWNDLTRPLIHVVVVGATDEMDLPMWKNHVPQGLSLVEIPHEYNRPSFAQAHGGLHAFGWYIPEGFVRDAPVPPPWEWFDRIQAHKLSSQ